MARHLSIEGVHEKVASMNANCKKEMHQKKNAVGQKKKSFMEICLLGKGAYLR